LDGESSAVVGSSAITLRTVDDGHGDHHALPHASESGAVTAGALLGLGDGNSRMPRPLAASFSLETLCAPAPPPHLIAARMTGFSAASAPENHGDARAAKLTQLLGRQTGRRVGAPSPF